MLKNLTAGQCLKFVSDDKERLKKHMFIMVRLSQSPFLNLTTPRTYIIKVATFGIRTNEQ